MKTGIIFLFISIGFLSCKKFVVVDTPATQLVSQNVFTSDASATAAMLGIYSNRMSSSGFASGGLWSISFLSGLSADELINYEVDPNINAFYKNSLAATNNYLGPKIWNEMYNVIYTSNAILAGLSSANGVSDSVIAQLTGEARFMRAFCNFYLVNLFGNVPIVTSTDYRINALVSRAPVDQVYDSIISDLLFAQSQLADDYYYSNGERIRPNRWAATAMLARVYLYTKNWIEADAQASAVINNTLLYDLAANPDSVFLKNSSEAIWQLMPVMPGINTNEGQLFILTDFPEFGTLSSSLLQSFEENDVRRMDWVDSIEINGVTYYYPFKYKIKTGEVVSEYSMVLRLAEQYLIRAEARAYENDLPGSTADLNRIRNRAKLGAATATDQAGLLGAIQHERQIELNTEWGHRWLDLKRTGTADAILKVIKAPDWEATDTLYPIPRTDISSNPNLNQNPGY